MAPTGGACPPAWEKALGPPTATPPAGVSWDVLTGSTSAAGLEAILQRLAEASVDVLIGTHMHFRGRRGSEAPEPVVVIDEQQRFGVEQRAKLLSKTRRPTPCSYMATPIPRTAALALFGGLDAVLYQAAAERHGAADHVRASKGRSRPRLRCRARRQRGEQVSWCVRLSGRAARAGREGIRRGSGTGDAAARRRRGVRVRRHQHRKATTTWPETTCRRCERGNLLASDRVRRLERGMLHGRRMRSGEKESRHGPLPVGETQVLVATTVIEVWAYGRSQHDHDRGGRRSLRPFAAAPAARTPWGAPPCGAGSLDLGFQIGRSARALAVKAERNRRFELASYDLSLRREGELSWQPAARREASSR